MRAWTVVGMALMVAACGHATHLGMGRDAVEGRDSPRARTHTELAALYYARGQYAIALQEINTALAIDGDYAPAHNVLGLVQAELREDAKAETSFRRAIDLQRNYSEAHNNYGWFLCQRGRIEAAVAQFEAALANPLYASPERALTNAGLCSLHKGDLAAAESYLERALRRSPNQPLALVGLADVHARMGRLIQARNLLKQAASHTELNARALWLGVRIERQLGDGVSESNYANQLQRRYPDSEEAYWLRRGQYDKTGSVL